MASPVPSEQVARTKGTFISATNENDARMSCLARLETFTYCPADKFIHTRPADLADAGFEYQRTADLFKCSRCGIEISDWKEGDKPVTVHRNRSRNCSFLRENFVNNEDGDDIVVASVDSSSSLSDSQEMTASLTPGATSRLSDIQSENKKLRDRITCKKCGAEKVETLFLPCRHLAVCEHCAERLDNCCVCQSKILGTVRVVMVPKIP